MSTCFHTPGNTQLNTGFILKMKESIAYINERKKITREKERISSGSDHT